jgi:hypothetical protein
VESDTAFTRVFLYRLLIYLSPFGLILLLWAPRIMRRTNSTGAVWLMLFWGWQAALVLVSPYAYCRFYQFYYDRYYLSEAVPYALVLGGVLLGIWSKAARERMPWWRWGVAVAILACFAGLVRPVARGPFAEPPDLLSEIDRDLGSDTLVLLYDGGHQQWRNLIGTPLAYSLHRPLFPVRQGDVLWSEGVEEISRRYARTVVLTPRPLRDVRMPPGMMEPSFYARYFYTYVLFEPLSVTEATGKSAPPGWRKWVDLPMRRMEVRHPVYGYDLIPAPESMEPVVELDPAGMEEV